MRNYLDQRYINSTKNRSRDNNTETCILETETSTEYFKFENGRLEEYDASRLNNRQVKLTYDEQVGLDEFNIPVENNAVFVN
jgi:hypothetical protein